jgi:hypothetical protein
MKILHPRSDFVIVEDYFSPAEARQLIAQILKEGELR